MGPKEDNGQLPSLHASRKVRYSNSSASQKGYSFGYPSEYIPSSRLAMEGSVMKFHVVIHKDPDSSYGVTVPDLPGCFSGGDTFEEALIFVREAIEGHVEVMLMEGYSIPEKKPLEVHKANADFSRGTWATVTVDLSKLLVNTALSQT